MAEYRLSVTRIDPNPEYDPAVIKSRNRGYFDPNYDGVAMNRTLEESVLNVILTNEEYAAVKRAVLEVSK